MLKKKRLAYDGRGNAVVNNESDIADAFERLGGSQLYAEKWVPFTKELAVMVVLSKDGVVSYPLVETVQKDSICHVVIAPAQIPQNAAIEAAKIAQAAIASFSGYGIFGVELFLLPDDSVVLNEIAPRYATTLLCDHSHLLVTTYMLTKILAAVQTSRNHRFLHHKCRK